MGVALSKVGEARRGAVSECQEGAHKLVWLRGAGAGGIGSILKKSVGVAGEAGRKRRSLYHDDDAEAWPEMVRKELELGRLQPPGVRREPK